MPNCRQCHTAKTEEDFYLHPGMPSGRLNVCKVCVRSNVRAHREKNITEARAYDRQRGKTEKRRAGVRAYAKANPATRRSAHLAWAARNPEKVAASTAVHNAVRDGRLFKGPCEVCGDRIVQGHHDDYTKPLEVRWLCDTHHKEHHNQIRELQRAA